MDNQSSGLSLLGETYSKVVQVEGLGRWRLRSKAKDLRRPHFGPVQILWTQNNDPLFLLPVRASAELLRRNSLVEAVGSGAHPLGIHERALVLQTGQPKPLPFFGILTPPDLPHNLAFPHTVETSPASPYQQGLPS